MELFSVSGLTLVLNRVLPEPHAGLLAGLLFGTKANLSRELYEALVASGTIHIIALSGMNISIITNLVASTLLPIVGKRPAAVLTLLLVIWFVWFVGASSTIVRAAIMGSITLLSVLTGRNYWAILSWILAVGIMLIIHFPWLFEISFQLSAMATLGIILFGGQRGAVNAQITIQQFSNITISTNADVLRIVGKSIGVARTMMLNNLHLTLAAQVFTIPLIMLYFKRISLIAPVSNLAIGWLITPLTVLGWATAILGWIWLPAGQIAAWFDWALLQYLIGVVVWTSRIPFASIGL